MHKILLATAIIFLLSGCNSSEPSPELSHNKVQIQQEQEHTVSYQDIIMKINDINTNEKTNKRVKNIVKEYQYNVSDDDSKNSARKKALTQVKILILEEIGVFVESYLELNKIVENKKYQKYFKEEIKNLTAGIVKTKILDEKFDGNTYYVKASVLVDPDSVSEGISEVLKIKANKSEINKLNKLLKSKEQEIDMRSNETIKLQKKVANQAMLNHAKIEEIKVLQIELKKTKKQLVKYQNNENFINAKIKDLTTKINKIKIKIKQKEEVACLAIKGMTRNELLNSIGKPSGTEGFGMNNPFGRWYYGSVRFTFNGGVVAIISGCD